jgi:hypothetical protein
MDFREQHLAILFKAEELIVNAVRQHGTPEGEFMVLPLKGLDHWSMTSELEEDSPHIKYRPVRLSVHEDGDIFIRGLVPEGGWRYYDFATYEVHPYLILEIADTIL